MEKISSPQGESSWSSNQHYCWISTPRLLHVNSPVLNRAVSWGLLLTQFRNSSPRNWASLHFSHAVSGLDINGKFIKFRIAPNKIAYSLWSNNRQLSHLEPILRYIFRGCLNYVTQPQNIPKLCPPSHTIGGSVLPLGVLRFGVPPQHPFPVICTF